MDLTGLSHGELDLYLSLCEIKFQNLLHNFKLCKKMLDPLFRFFNRILASAERDRMDDKLNAVSLKFDHFDDRMDALEISQARQNEKLSTIHLITLANNEALEQKLNRSNITAEMVREIVDARINGFQDSLRILEGLITQLLLQNHKDK